MENAYCRFCAEPKSADKLLSLELDPNKRNEVVLKLAFLNAIYVDICSRDSLPKTVCFICFDSLNKAYDFLNRVKKSQDVLSTFFSTNDCSKYDLSDDERGSFDDFLGSDTVPEHATNIKQETLPADSRNMTNYSAEIKLEPKEELSDTTGLQNSSEIFDQALNVQDLLGAALNRSFSPNIQIVADYGSEINDRKISSWKQYSWLCSFCNTGFPDVDLLRAHAKASHGKCSAFSCTDCSETVKKDDFNWYIKHVRKHKKNLK